MSIRPNLSSRLETITRFAFCSSTFLLFVLPLFSNHPSLEAASKRRKPPLEVRHNSFGPTPMGQKALLKCQLINTSNQHLDISLIKTSCGCTSYDLAQDQIPAGGRVTLSITVDTQQKMGFISKAIRVYLKSFNIPFVFQVKGEVIPNAMSHAGHGQKKDHLFSARCASCHITPAQNLKGYPLYLAACATCHGSLRQGGFGPSLQADRYNDSWLKTTREGRGNMVGFHNDHGGYLNDRQVESLMSLLSGPTPKIPDTSSGLRVYQQSCSPCHGSSRLGPIGPDIRFESLEAFSSSELKSMISHGTDHPCMPAFSIQKGGHLSDRNIEKLIQFLK